MLVLPRIVATDPPDRRYGRVEGCGTLPVHGRWVNSSLGACTILGPAHLVSPGRQPEDGVSSLQGGGYPNTDPRADARGSAASSSRNDANPFRSTPRLP